MTHDYGPLRTYEITWRSRPPEMVQGHQVTFGSLGLTMFGPARNDLPPRFHIHGMWPGGRWRLVITGLEADVICIRDVTEQVDALEAMGRENPVPS